MNYVYILTCGDGSLYTGWTNDLEHRVISHSTGNGARYTRGHLPVRLVYFETFGDRIDAMKREYAVKQLPREKKLELVSSLSADDSRTGVIRQVNAKLTKD
jgi:putative endonuclease